MKIGRPTLAKAERKGKILGVRLTADERRSVDRVAQKQGLAPSKWARETLLAAASKE